MNTKNHDLNIQWFEDQIEALAMANKVLRDEIAMLKANLAAVGVSAKGNLK